MDVGRNSSSSIFNMNVGNETAEATALPIRGQRMDLDLKQKNNVNQK